MKTRQSRLPDVEMPLLYGQHLLLAHIMETAIKSTAALGRVTYMRKVYALDHLRITRPVLTYPLLIPVPKEKRLLC